MNNIELAIDAKATLAEGPVWHPVEKKLYWVDIENHELHCYDPEDGKDITLNVNQCIGMVVPVHNGRLLAGLEDCIAKVDVASGSIEPIIKLEKNKPNNRCNDGKCDPSGRLWVGTMNFGAREKAGSLYRINSDYQVTRVLNKVSISNGIAWSVDQKRMYYIDSPTYLVQAFDYDKDTGGISNPYPVISIPEEMGLPDGMTIDEEGMLWIAHWGGAQVSRWNPVDGELLSRLKIPVPHVTSCTFGGTSLNILFITTAREGLSDEELAKYPLSGSVFAARVNVKGLETSFFKE